MKTLAYLIFLISFSVNAEMFISISGENIVGHDYSQHDQFNIKIDDTKLVDENGNYKYKYKNGGLVPLSQPEISQHPNFIARQDIKNKVGAKKDALERLKLCDPEDIPTAFLKDLCLQYKEIK